MRRSLLLVLGFILLAGEAATAQTLGTPVFMSPYRSFRHSELAGYISDPGSGYSIALEGEYRRAWPKFDGGLRAAYLDLNGSLGSRFAVGADVRAPLAHRNESFPLDASFTLGASFADGDGSSLFLIPVGVTLGRRILLEGSNTSFVPYVHPVIAPAFGGGNSDVNFGLGLGVNISFTQQLDLRVSGALGDYEGVAIGVAWHR